MDFKYGVRELTKKEISEEIMRDLVGQNSFPKTYSERNREVRMSVSNIDPIIYVGMAEPNIFVDIKVSDPEGLLSFSQRVELGAEFYKGWVRKNVPYGEEYFREVNPKVSDLLIRILNEKK